MRTTPQIEGLSDWRPLARGGFAVVWEARQESLNRLVAVKVDHRKLDSGPERDRFLREAGAAGRMSGHPGIVTVHDAGLLPDDRPFLVMELCTGGSLTRRLELANRPTQEWVREVGVRIADALAAAHEQGVLHRDVKPANVLIDQYGHAGLADFGLAVMPDPGMELAETLEALTPAYAPPEAFVPHSPTERGDVYSLAATLYALLSGHPPRSPGNDKPDLEAALARLGDPIGDVPGVDPGLMAVLLRALDTDPNARPSAAGFSAELAALPLAEPVGALTPPGSVSNAPGAGSPLAPTARRYAVDLPSRRHARPHPRHGYPAPLRRRGPVLLAAAAALVLIAVVVGLSLGPRADTAASVPPPSAAGPTLAPAPTAPSEEASAFPSATPTAPAPAGFSDCSDQLGDGVLCGPNPPQCWGGLPSAFDAPIIATPARCEGTHVYQTFAAAPLPFPIRRQSQLDGAAAATQLCTVAVVNSMLTPAQRRDDWEVYPIPPQTEGADDVFFRCVFGRGERNTAVLLNSPT